MVNAIPVVTGRPDVPADQLLTVLRRAFTDLALDEAVQPPQAVTLLPGGGDVIAYQGVVDGLYGVKVSPYLPNVPGGPVVTAWSLLIGMDTGEPRLLVDSMALTALRTAATTALAVDLLAPSRPSVLAVIGAGPLAQAHMTYACAVREFGEVRAFSPSLAAKERLSPFGTDVVISSTVQDAVRGADVVLLCTGAAEPLVDVGDLAEGALVTSISTNVPGAHEVAPQALTAMDVYGDYRPTITASAGEMVLASEQGLWSAERLRGDLPELLTGRCPGPSGDRPVFFRSIGLGIEDVAVASLLIP
jgi:L-arginine dehydrogenase